MVHSPLFWCLLLLAPVAYWNLPGLWRPGFLALVSMGYIATIEPTGLIVMTAIALLVYWRALPGIIYVLTAYLAYYKYLPIVYAASSDPAAAIAIPIGISYFCFKLIHYSIETGRGSIAAHSLPQFFSYVFLFPIFTAGPIERFDHFLANREDRWLRESAVDGLTRILHGLIKKFTVATLVYAYLAEKIPMTSGPAAAMNVLSAMPAYKLWGAMILLYLYFYFDFSAYSDIAIGGSRLFGLRVLENFNFPLTARNIGDYWRRWHMTLSGWCQSYIYMPTIGWSRNPYIAAYCSFFVMGMWHAATPARLGWALHHATGVAIYQTWNRVKRKRKWAWADQGVWNYAAIAVTFLYVAASGVYLIVDGLDAYSSLRLLGRLFAIDLPA